MVSAICEPVLAKPAPPVSICGACIVGIAAHNLRQEPKQTLGDSSTKARRSIHPLSTASLSAPIPCQTPEEVCKKLL